MAALMYHALQCRANEVSPSQPCCAALLSLCHLGSLFLYLRVIEWRLTAMLVRHTLTSYLHPRTSAALCSPQEMLQNGVGPSPSLSWLEAPTQRSSLFPIKQLAIMLSTHLLWANLAAFGLASNLETKRQILNLCSRPYEPFCCLRKKITIPDNGSGVGPSEVYDDKCTHISRNIRPARWSS